MFVHARLDRSHLHVVDANLNTDLKFLTVLSKFKKTEKLMVDGHRFFEHLNSMQKIKNKTFNLYVNRVILV